jgi:acyl-CoA synthetase (AMP-forming)/AMP-acid ligase II
MLPQVLLSEVVLHKITGLAGVPIMWSQLANTRWPAGDYSSVRYATNTGGRMPGTILAQLRRKMPGTTFYLMYGLTEAFRSSYLDPAQIDRKRGSIGKAIPEVELFVLNEQGEVCDVDEPGELVHSGALVTMGYWNNPDATARKFRPLPPGISPTTELSPAVWTGDIVRRDADGFLYFQDRNDNMMKCSGYRISPSEIEDVIIESGLAHNVVAIGIPDAQAGQRVGIALVPSAKLEDYDFAIRHICARELPPYMQPDQVLLLEQFPLNANGKPDRAAIAALFSYTSHVETDD